MYFGKLKAIAEKELQKTVTDVVVSIPPYFTDAQRHAMLDAAEIAGLNILRLMHDTTASALQWGITKTDLPEGTPKYVAFVDCGQSDCSVSIVAFQKGKMMVCPMLLFIDYIESFGLQSLLSDQVKGVAWERNLGGRDFDEVLLNHFVEEFKTKYKIDIRTNAKALFRLRLACERVKKVLSANAQAPINVECLMNDKDVAGLVDRYVRPGVDVVSPTVRRLKR
jgi:heat shock protein 4